MGTEATPRVLEFAAYARRASELLMAEPDREIGETPVHHEAVISERLPSGFFARNPTARRMASLVRRSLRCGIWIRHEGNVPSLRRLFQVNSLM